MGVRAYLDFGFVLAAKQNKKVTTAKKDAVTIG